MKSIIATGILLGFGTAAVAGPYVNIENNAGLTGSINASDNVSVYGELAAAFDDVNNYATKLGVKYSF
jgi:outer membrane autotransporter protein